MPSALLAGQTVLASFDDPVPNPLDLPDGTVVFGADSGWANDSFAIVPASFTDTPPQGLARETARTYAIADGTVLITRVWQALPVPIPATITNAQARAALLALPSPVNAGKTLLDDVNAAVATAGGDALIAWEYANDITRDGSLVQAMSAQLGISSEMLDQLFIQAAAIKF